MKIHQQSKDNYVFFCPGCNCAHGFNLRWTWNNNFDSPTINPSLLSIGENRCHCFVKDGKIQFLMDCSHDLKGKTVEMPEWDL
jgi:hypothetical protein